MPSNTPDDGVVLTSDEVTVVRWLLIYWGATDDEKERRVVPPSRASIQALATRLAAVDG